MTIRIGDITNVVEKYNTGHNACKCHEPGQLHQYEVEIKGETVKLMKDEINEYYYVGFGKCVRQTEAMTATQAARCLEDHFQDTFDLSALEALPGF
ncbi:MAG: hypothetical protein EHM33_00780 [Chloroflexi bacterium]|nr:MAG: hypothetical protein EHM33_00780 [Chloroflexota bacterium]